MELLKKIKFDYFSAYCEDGFDRMVEDKNTKNYKKKQIYCDKKIPSELLNKHIVKHSYKYVRNIECEEYIKNMINEQNIKIKKVLCYSIDDEVMFYFDYKCYGDYGEFLGHINSSQHIFITIHGAHPGLLTDDFIYCNSDGSGPYIFNYKKGKLRYGITAYDCITRLNMLLFEFGSDMHH
jgi:hypothetical protein